MIVNCDKGGYPYQSWRGGGTPPNPGQGIPIQSPTGRGGVPLSSPQRGVPLGRDLEPVEVLEDGDGVSLLPTVWTDRHSQV